MIGAVFAATLAAASPSADPPPVFAPAPCADARLEGQARCGHVEVPEARGMPASRRIRLYVVVIPAVNADRALPPLYETAGGPGLAVSDGAGFYLTDGAAYRSRDIVLVDQRGTGHSNPLSCEGLDAAPGREMYEPEAVRRCRDTLEARADLTRYGTVDAVADLESVREALGHERLDLIGLSYGTTVALRYMATHPDRVRAAVLWGAAPPSAMPPRDHAPNAEAAIRRLFADCRADQACAGAYPDLDGDFDRALARLPQSGDPSREQFAEKLRTVMYTPAGYRRLPRILHAAASGDLGPYRAVAGGNAASAIADGMYLSVTCSESLAAMDYEAAATRSRETRFGDYRLRRQRAACALWPAISPGPAFFEPVRVDTPILFLSGGRDPVTPAGWAADLQRRLPASRQVTVEHGGHLFDGLNNVGCVDELILAFFRTGSAEGLNVACVATMTPPPFDVSPS